MAELTSEQRAAVESRGKTIVSASAGSGKTFVMIEKLTRAIEGGADLDNVLAVTFTKKAASQMKDKLRASLIKKVETADGRQKARLKEQISKIPSANISTIHSFCSRLLRTYFYALDIDGGFDIMSDDDAVAKDLKARALDNIFERRYEQNDGEFIHLLKCFSKKRSDNALRRLVLESYSKVRNVAHYKKMLGGAEKLYTDEGFEAVCADMSAIFAQKYSAIEEAVKEFKETFPQTKNRGVYDKIFAEMLSAAEYSKSGLFLPPVSFTVTPKPRDAESDKAAGEMFKEFKADISKRFNAVRGDLGDEAAERGLFFKSGRTATAFCALLLEFDGEYSSIKRDENKLDYNDLEHLTLELLQSGEIRAEINSKFRYVYVDEYQDVNSVQEEIISSLDGEIFLVGDVKQAIYGFRGSKSLFFADKYNRFEGGGTALKLSNNFRSCAAVLDFVNDTFSVAMTEKTCGFDYAETSRMTEGGAYPEGSGLAELNIFGKEENIEKAERGVYSVVADSRDTSHTREGLAVLQLVERELNSQHFDLKRGEYVDTQPGDICILTRKNKGGSTEGIVRALRDAGYSVTGAQEPNICALSEVRQMLDILSLIDNAEQDIPLATTMLSPLGGFSEDELAAIRIAFKREGRASFRQCCKLYAKNVRGAISQKLNTFAQKLAKLRDLSEILSAGELIDYILESGLEAAYSAGGGEQLKNILRLAAEGPKLTLSAFLDKIKSGGYDIKASSSASSDSIKIMTMHAAKGLEFPVVIIADICRTFKGMDYSELPFDEKYGFAPKYFDTENMLFRPTILRRLVKLRSDGEELKNELNLFYVACTRAMCKLHIVAEEVLPYGALRALGAKCYAEVFDMSRVPCRIMEPRAEVERAAEEVTYISDPDDKLYSALSSRFMRQYAYADSVGLPVKSSASAILKSVREDEPYFAEHSLFADERETGAERGTAYHRFLELCDFSVKTLDGIRKELINFTQSGKLSARQAELLSADELCEIVNMPVFSDLGCAELFREQEFLCRIKACDLFPTEAEDQVLVQGVIDLLVCGKSGVCIIDYKYSVKSDEQLVGTYSRQLALYKKAVSIIRHVPEEEIGAAIINIFRRTLIIL